MTFGSPELLLALLLIPLALVAYLFFQRRRSRYVVRFTNVDLLSNLVPRTPAWRRHVPPALYLLAIGAIVVGLANPSVMVAVPRDEATIMLAMDVSRSMRATDVDPTRLAAAQAAATDFVAQLPESFRVGLVVFSTEARLVVPPTTDREDLQRALAALRADGGTALGDAIALAVETAVADETSTAPEPSPSVEPSPKADPSDEPSATPAPTGSPDPGADTDADAESADEPPVVATVLLSDGANSTGTLEPLEAASTAVQAGVPVYTIALGTPDGIVDVPNQFGMLQPMAVPPDTETLAEVAEMTGGRSYEAPTAEDVAAIY